MRLQLHYPPRPWLISLALVALVPPLAIWLAALADSLGVTHILTGLPVPASVTSRPERSLLLASFLGVMLGLPVLAFLSAVLATMSFEVRVASWEITASLRLPAPPWKLTEIAAVLLLLIGALLFVAMAGHLTADCLFGTDCLPS